MIRIELPIAEAETGPVFDRVEPNDHNDRLLSQWEAPLVWHHQKSYLLMDRFFQGKPCLHFAFEKRVPQEVWFIGWHLWYDNCLVHRRRLADATLTGRFGFEETTFGYTTDNQRHVAPWTGMVVRMQDLRQYYFLTLEYPNRVVLYRRQDDQWTEIAAMQVHLDVWTEYELKLEMHGQMFHAWLDGELLFTAADYTWSEGWCGLRATCTSAVTAFTIESRQEPLIETLPQKDFTSPSSQPDLPTAEVLRDIDCSSLGNLSKTIRHNATVEPGFFAHEEGMQMLVDLFDAPDGSSHALLDAEGNVVWKAKLPGVGRMLPTPPREDGGRDFYAVGRDELMVVDGRSGEVRQKQPTPAGVNGKQPSVGNGPFLTADLDGSGRADHFFLTFGANSEEIITIGPDLKERWRVEAISGNGHGHHNAVCDVDGDGREEIFAGCLLLDADGKVLWRQDEITRRLKVPNGGHVDSSVMGFFDSPDASPTLHMASSSAGHLVCDARTGELLAAHPQGHAQSVSAGRVLPGSDAVCAINSNRWGNYGVTGVYAPDGRRVGRFQPGFVCQHARPLNWTAAGFEHLLVVDGPGWRGIYDYHGHRLIELDSLVPGEDAFAQRYDRVQAFRAPLIPGDPRDVIILRRGTTLRLIRPAGDCPAGNTYAPRRRTNVSWPT
ncbi:MAG: hypothetical protein ACLFV7_03505 [Phycisphaerae bacterium]